MLEKGIWRIIVEPLTVAARPCASFMRTVARAWRSRPSNPTRLSPCAFSNSLEAKLSAIFERCSESSGS